MEGWGTGELDNRFFNLSYPMRSLAGILLL